MMILKMIMNVIIYLTIFSQFDKVDVFIAKSDNDDFDSDEDNNFEKSCMIFENKSVNHSIIYDKENYSSNNNNDNEKSNRYLVKQTFPL